jgi:ABC-type sugar transport system ATPase subunit
VKSSGGSLTLQILGENIPLPLPSNVVHVLHERRARRIRVGIRPPDVRIAPEGQKQAFHAVVYSFEPMGSKSIVTLKAVDGSLVRALVDGHLTFEMDRRTQFRIDPHLLIIFDAESRRFLARSTEGAGET